VVGAMSTVLVVDDDVDIARFIEVNLKLEGFDVLLAHDGEEALGIIAEGLPDLALLDVMMPRIDGVELCRRLRSDPLTASLPIIMLTAKSLSADKVVGLTAGADDYIIKPFDTLELVARVRSTLRRNAEMRAVSPLTGLPGNHRINEEIAAARDIVVEFLGRDLADADPALIRTAAHLIPREIDPLRVIDIVGLDKQADGGTHVLSTAEVGRVAVTGTESKGKGNKRIRIAVVDA